MVWRTLVVRVTEPQKPRTVVRDQEQPFLAVTFSGILAWIKSELLSGADSNDLFKTYHQVLILCEIPISISK